MKKVLGILFVMVIMAVSALAAPSDLEIVPVYLNVPPFVRLSVDPSDPDGQFNLSFDPANSNLWLGDTVTLLAEANVSYTVSSSVVPVAGYDNWVSLVMVVIDPSVSELGHPGSVTFDTTASMYLGSMLNFPEWGAIPLPTHIADVVFTISAI